MNNLSLRTPWIYYLIITITLGISFLSFGFPSFINKYEIILKIILILGIGISHGATEHLIYNCLSANKGSALLNKSFYIFYIFWIFVYSLCWYLFPLFALMIFIIVNIYYLGQSNLYYLSLDKNEITKTFIYCAWGSFVVFSPIISNFKEVDAILEVILGKKSIIALENKEYFFEFIIILNFFIISTLFILNYATRKELLR